MPSFSSRPTTSTSSSMKRPSPGLLPWRISKPFCPVASWFPPSNLCATRTDTLRSISASLVPATAPWNWCGIWNTQGAFSNHASSVKTPSPTAVRINVSNLLAHPTDSTSICSPSTTRLRCRKPDRLELQRNRRPPAGPLKNRPQLPSQILSLGNGTSDHPIPAQHINRIQRPEVRNEQRPIDLPLARAFEIASHLALCRIHNSACAGYWNVRSTRHGLGRYQQPLQRHSCREAG